jgi:hypothetical protein
VVAVLIVVVVVGILVGCFVASIFLRRYRDSDRPSPGWHATDEVFSDPSTHRIMRVWLDAAGNRHYVAERTSEQSP